MWINKKYYEELLKDQKNAFKHEQEMVSKYWNTYMESGKKEEAISNLQKENKKLYDIISTQHELIKHILNKTFTESEEFEYVMLRRKNERPLLYKNGKEIGFDPKQITIQWSYDNPDGITVDLGEI